MKPEILEYIKANPGSTCSAVAKGTLFDGGLHGYSAVRRHIDDLVSEGLVQRREYRGISVFYPTEKDNTNPAHYRSQPVECIEFTENLNFCMGNAFKYIWRYRKKNGLEDLQKAEWYLCRQIDENPLFVCLDADDWGYFVGMLEGCDFLEGQFSALMHILSAAFTEDRGFLASALICVRSLIEDFDDRTAD